MATNPYQALPTQQPRTPVAAPAPIVDQKARLQSMLAKQQLAASAKPQVMPAPPVVPGTVPATGATGQPIAVPALPSFPVRTATTGTMPPPPGVKPAAPVITATAGPMPPPPGVKPAPVADNFSDAWDALDNRPAQSGYDERRAAKDALRASAADERNAELAAKQAEIAAKDEARRLRKLRRSRTGGGI